MKTLTILFFAFAVFLSSCSTKQLTGEQASQMIKQQEKYPKTVDYDIYSSDPSHAKKTIDVGLEKEGLVSVSKTQKLGDVGKPLIQFTEKAKPYLLSTSENDKALNMQKVKIADEDFSEVTAIRTENNGKDAVVEYSMAYKNITPFSVLTNINLSAKPVRKAHFSLTDNGWRFEK